MLVDVDARHVDARRGGVEGLVGYLAERAAVERVGEFRVEEVFVERLRAEAAYLLVGREEELYLAVLLAGVVVEILRHRHYLGEAGLVVRAEQRRAVGHDEVPALVVLHVREVLGAQHDAELLVERHVPAVVVLHNARLYVLAAQVWRRVEVRAEAYRGRAFAVRGDFPVNAARLRNRGALRAERAQLVREHGGEVALLLRARHGGLSVGRLRVYLYVFEESVEKLRHFVRLSFYSMLFCRRRPATEERRRCPSSSTRR